MPNWRGLLERWPHAQLQASAEAVGLPKGQMGNSEVGHLNLGAGQPVVQDLPRIDKAIDDGSFFNNEALLAAVRRAAQPGRRLHLIGLIGPGGVHSVDRHAVAIAKLAAKEGARDVVVHALLDGRDTPPQLGRALRAGLREEAHRGAIRGARIATVGGRYYAMDRDKRWDRVEQRHTTRSCTARARSRPPRPMRCWRHTGAARPTSSSQPTVIHGVDGTVRDGDAVIHFNFRADRARQLTHALADGDEFDGFDRGRRPRDLLVVTMTEYEGGLPVRGRLPAAAGQRVSPRSSRASAGASSTSPRRRSTPTSLTSSMGASRRLFRARTGCWCRRPKSRPTTFSPR